jgi:hydrogenase-4 component F
VRQTDFKRMLAYSSVEHMGLFALALGLGGKALYGIMLHVIGNGLGKGMMFMVAGNINRAFGSKSREVARGALVRMPWSGALFLAGFFAVTGSPPFVTFASEFSFFSASFSRGGLVLTLLLGLLMSIAFLGMAQTVLPVVFGNPPATRERTKYRDSAILIVPPLALLLIGALAGLWLPEPLHSLFIAAAALLEVKP